MAGSGSSSTLDEKSWTHDYKKAGAEYLWQPACLGKICGFTSLFFNRFGLLHHYGSYFFIRLSYATLWCLSRFVEKSKVSLSRSKTSFYVVRNLEELLDYIYGNKVNRTILLPRRTLSGKVLNTLGQTGIFRSQMPLRTNKTTSRALSVIKLRLPCITAGLIFLLNALRRNSN